MTIWNFSMRFCIAAFATAPTGAIVVSVPFSMGTVLLPRRPPRCLRSNVVSVPFSMGTVLLRRGAPPCAKPEFVSVPFSMGTVLLPEF